MSIISTSLTVRGQPSSRFHVEAWLPFRNYEMMYYTLTLPLLCTAQNKRGLNCTGTLLLVS